MNKGATSFIQNRRRVVAITDDRINHIVEYVVHCYQIILNDAPQYSKTNVKAKTTLSFEDYLKMELVDSYLIPNKHLILSNCSDLANITFHYENQKRYIDVSDGKEKPDKIDIYISKLGLQEVWNEQDEHVYFVIECKRIGSLADSANYVDDTKKFANRIYKTLRLPFEGQLAFIENKKLSVVSVSSEIDNNLKKMSSELKTEQFLTPIAITASFHGGYTSIHKRNHSKNASFKVYHLLFNYSSLVTD